MALEKGTLEDWVSRVEESFHSSLSLKDVELLGDWELPGASLGDLPPTLGVEKGIDVTFSEVLFSPHHLPSTAVEHMLILIATTRLLSLRFCQRLWFPLLLLTWGWPRMVCFLLILMSRSNWGSFILGLVQRSRMILLQNY